MTLTEAIIELDEAVGKFIGSEDNDNKSVLSAVFKLNKEIGRKLKPTGDPRLKSLQLKVNDVTIAAKRLDRRSLAAAMERVRADLLES